MKPMNWKSVLLIPLLAACLSAYGEPLNPVCQTFSACETLAEQGDMEAQYHLAQMYSGGKGTSQDLAKGEYWYRKSAEQGSQSAQLAIGLMYRAGRGVPKDNAKATYWLNKAQEKR